MTGKGPDRRYPEMVLEPLGSNTRKTALTEDNLTTLDTTLQQFHHYQNVF